MIVNYKLFEKLMSFPTPVMNAIQNTPGAEITEKGLKLEVSRYQKPEQAGMTSIRTGVFYLPELKSPYGKHYKQRDPKSSYGGSQYITGTIILKNPYTLKAGTGGLGPQKAFIELYGKDTYKELESDIFSMVVTRGGWSKANHMLVEEWIQELFDKWDGDVDLSYDIAKHSNEGNRLRYALQEHIIAHKIRNKGYDSVLSYSISGGFFRLSEVFDLRQMEYPEESGFLVEKLNNNLTGKDLPKIQEFLKSLGLELFPYNLNDPTSEIGNPLVRDGMCGIRASYKHGKLNVWFTNLYSDPNHPIRKKVEEFINLFSSLQK